MAAASAQGGAGPGPRRVLVVDDDPDILATLSAVLEQMLGVPVEVVTAASGDEARRRIEQGERFDLLLTDERMPGLTGSELLEWVRVRSPETTRVLMSAFYQEYAGQRLKERTGAHAFIAKPFRLESMLSDLRRLLATHTA